MNNWWDTRHQDEQNAKCNKRQDDKTSQYSKL